MKSAENKPTEHFRDNIYITCKDVECSEKELAKRIFEEIKNLRKENPLLS